MPKKIKVAVLGGGPSSERTISLMSARQVAKHLPREKYNVFFIDITKDGRWLLKSGRKIKSLQLFSLKTGFKKSELKKFDIAFIALHGPFGEDGKIQALLEIIGLPYTGSGVLASALAMDKDKASQVAENNGFLTPRRVVINSVPKNLKQLVRNLRLPFFVKPNRSGSSIGMNKVTKLSQLGKALGIAFKEDSTVIIDEAISGREITCGVMGNTGQGKVKALPPVEIIPDGEFFDYRAKYFTPKTQEICPAKISQTLTKKVQNLAIRIHTLLGCNGLTRNDFILRKGRYYYLETNTIPGLTKESICPREAEAIGMSFGKFLDWQVELALNKDWQLKK